MLTPAAAAMSRKVTSAAVGCWRAVSAPADRATATARPRALRHCPIGREHDLRTRVILEGQREVLHGALGARGSLEHDPGLRHLLDVTQRDLLAQFGQDRRAQPARTRPRDWHVAPARIFLQRLRDLPVLPFVAL